MNIGDRIIYEHWSQNSVIYLTGTVISFTPRQHKAVIELEPPIELAAGIQGPLNIVSTNFGLKAGSVVGGGSRIKVKTSNLFVRFEPPAMGESVK